MPSAKAAKNHSALRKCLSPTARLRKLASLKKYNKRFSYPPAFGTKKLDIRQVLLS